MTKHLWVEKEIHPGSAALFAQQVKACRDDETVMIYVNSVGGELDAAGSMGLTLMHSGRPTLACILLGDSAALVVALGAGSRIVASDGSALVHQVTGHDIHDGAGARDLQQMADHLIETGRGIADVLAKHSITSAMEWRRLMAERTRLSAKDMLDRRLVSGISAWSGAEIRQARQLPSATLLDRSPPAGPSRYWRRT